MAQASRTPAPAPTGQKHAAYRPVFARPESLQEIFVADAWTSLVKRVEITCAQGQALMAISGEAGTGKSTMARWLYETLPLNQHEVLLVSLIGKEVQSGWLIPKIAKYLGVGPQEPGDDLLAATLEKLELLIQEQQTLVVLIDAAEKIQTADAYSEIEALLNLQSLAGRCLTFILIGGRALDSQLQACDSLAAQLSLRAEIGVLSRKDCRAYIAARVQHAGEQVTVDITPDAYDAVFALTRGVIAKINSLMENCFVEAMIAKRDAIDAPFVHAIAKQFMLGNALQDLAPNTGTPKPAKTAVPKPATPSAPKKSKPAAPKKTPAPKAVPPTAVDALAPPHQPATEPPVESAAPALSPTGAADSSPSGDSKKATKKPKVALSDLFNDDEE